MTFSPKREASRERQVLQQSYGRCVHPPTPNSHSLIFSAWGEAGKRDLVRETQDHVSVLNH
ncbi:hypothetical protein B7P43_G16404 [Cryptotermes secundus]|uniref:Uncharacterized protein n=1 Tax=Cryptotermes secundus TaxID=105785 RepID=A0A2J7QII0_9NEOP|nr:hypothetical protein B7P43_G16404 [Cryptotermes secundus]